MIGVLRVIKKSCCLRPSKYLNLFSCLFNFKINILRYIKNAKMSSTWKTFCGKSLNLVMNKYESFKEVRGAHFRAFAQSANSSDKIKMNFALNVSWL